MRTRTLVWLAIVATVAPVWVAGVAMGGGAARDPDATPVATVPVSPDGDALAVLRRWDRSRARAWAAGDPGALSRLYVRGSATGARDSRDLGEWVRRGLRVVGLHQQVMAVRVTDRDPGRFVMVVTERTVDGVAVGARRRTAVPASGWATHRVSLRLLHHRWRVADVTGRPSV
jgi:hypothetical protein